jgi:parallel beta-helix repeat protein
VLAVVTAAVVVTVASAPGSGAVGVSGPVLPGGGGPVLAVDTSGSTVPDTDYPIPDGAVFLAPDGNDAAPGTVDAPVRTLTRAIDAAPDGGTVVVRAGTYRDGYGAATTNAYAVVPKSVTIQAYPHEQVWFDGTDQVAGSRWTKVTGGRWSIAWKTPGFCDGGYYKYRYNAQPTKNTGPCAHYDMYRDPLNPAAGDPQMVFVNGAYVHEVTALAQVKPGTFFYDWSAKKLTIASDPTANTVELAARPSMLLAGSATPVNLLGIGVRRFATNEYSNNTTSAVTLRGPGSTIENDVFEQMAGGAAMVSSRGGVLRDSVLVDNGFDAIGSNGSFLKDPTLPDGLLVEGNYIARNNTERFGTGCSVSCAQAGMKIAHMNGFTVRGNVVENNNGHGIWCDLACSNGVIVDNLVRGNALAGIFYEVSDTGIIASNLVVANGGYGLRVDSANTRIYNNTVVDNTGSGGIWVYDDNRSPGYGGWTDVGPDTRDMEIANNVVTDSLGSDTLVRYQSGKAGQTNTRPEDFVAVLDHNAYYRGKGPTRNIVRWLSTTSTNYRSVAALSAALGWDADSLDVTTGPNPFLTAPGAGDYTVPAASPASAAGTALPPDVAAAIGVPADAGQDLGALVWPGTGP